MDRSELAVLLRALRREREVREWGVTNEGGNVDRNPLDFALGWRDEVTPCDAALHVGDSQPARPDSSILALKLSCTYMLGLLL